MSYYKMLGIHLGYPVCCVNEFNDLCEAGHMPGKLAGKGPWSGTGFIPCAAHREQIRNGVSVEALITNRRSRYPFPRFDNDEAHAFVAAYGLQDA